MSLRDRFAFRTSGGLLKTHLSSFLKNAEACAEIQILRGPVPVTKLTEWENP